MQTGHVTPDPEAYLFSATGIPEERMELDEMQLVYPFLCTKVNPSFIVHLGLGDKTIFYELRKHILTTRLKEDLLTAAIEEAYTDS